MEEEKMKLQITKKLPIILGCVILVLFTTMILGIGAQAKEKKSSKDAEQIAVTSVVEDKSVTAGKTLEVGEKSTAVTTTIEGEDGTMVVSSSEEETTGSKAWAAALAVGLAAAAGAIGIGLAIAKSAEGISRQPEAEGKIRTTLMLGLVFIETAIIYALIVAILIIFVM